MLLTEATTETRLSCELIQHVDRTIFGPLYEWAGCYRTVWISKPGIPWPPPDFLEANMQAFEDQALRKVEPKELASAEAFCKSLALIQGEFLTIHPFREGNARTIKLVTDLLAVQTGRLPLRYDQSEQGQRAYIEAAKAAFRRDYGPLQAVMQEALQRR